MAGGDRPAVTAAGSGRQAVEAVWRIESARIVGTLARFTGDFSLAEDVAQEALAEALVAWSRDGVPRNPAGWLLTVGRRRAVDAFRRRSALDERYAALAQDLGEGGAASGAVGAPKVVEQHANLPWDPDRIDDDVLALMFIACHPVLSREAQVALTLRVLGGLTSDDLVARGTLPGSHLLPSVRGELLRRLGRLDDARGEIELAIRLCENRRERTVLTRKLADLH